MSGTLAVTAQINVATAPNVVTDAVIGSWSIEQFMAEVLPETRAASTALARHRGVLPASLDVRLNEVDPSSSWTDAQVRKADKVVKEELSPKELVLPTTFYRETEGIKEAAQLSWSRVGSVDKLIEYVLQRDSNAAGSTLDVVTTCRSALETSYPDIFSPRNFGKIDVAFQLALAEAMANHFIHGNCCLPILPITVSYGMYGDGVFRWRSEDVGRGFDPEALPDPTLPENIGSVHGRGILLLTSYFPPSTSGGYQPFSSRFLNQGRGVELCIDLVTPVRETMKRLGYVG